MKVIAAEVLSVALPFRRPFSHAAGARSSSDSVFLKIVAENGATGYGECLPREYVTGESQSSAHELLAALVPRLLEHEFTSLAEVHAFLASCDGQAPAEWTPRRGDHAAWCAVDLALLDGFSRAFRQPLPLGTDRLPQNLRYSAALSAEPGSRQWKRLLKLRLFGIRDVKVKLGREAGLEALSAARQMLGRSCVLRVDANMAWTLEEARAVVPRLAALGVAVLEQPLAAAAIEDMAVLQQESSIPLAADESLTDAESLKRLLAAGACRVANIRISKCGGLVASLRRSQEALAGGLAVQLGCQVGESSLLSAAHLRLLAAVGRVAYAEGCFGSFLLNADPAQPALRFGYGGRPPRLAPSLGLGVAIDEAILRRFTTRITHVGDRRARNRDDHPRVNMENVA